jgi:hypothetical protein
MIPNAHFFVSSEYSADSIMYNAGITIIMENVYAIKIPVFPLPTL